MPRYLVKHYSEYFYESGFWMRLTFKSMDSQVKAHCLLYCGWASYNQLKTSIEQRLTSKQKGILPTDSL